MIYYGCPKCGVAMASPESLAGGRDTCPECGNVATIPTTEPVSPRSRLRPVDLTIEQAARK